jgi:hypothetical protein
MSHVYCFTSASFSYFDRVRTLRETVRQFHPDWNFWLCLSDKAPPGFEFDPHKEGIDGVVQAEDLPLPDIKQWLFEHDLVELCTAVKGPMLCHLLELGAQKVFYLDPDIALFSSLREIETLLDTYDLVLTPHQVEPDDNRQAIVDNEIGSLKHGIYNLGFLAVANTSEGNRFARWWRDRLVTFCFDDIPNGLFTDQRWCDHAPVFFPNTFILRDAGYNVASWNQTRRPITIENDGTIRAAGRPLRFFHFTKITWVGEKMLERYSGGRMDVFELIKWYRARLSANAMKELPKGWWAYGTYADGTPIERAHRLAFRSDEYLRKSFADPYVAPPNSRLRPPVSKESKSGSWVSRVRNRIAWPFRRQSFGT